MAKADIWVWDFNQDYLTVGVSAERGVIGPEDGLVESLGDVYLKTHDGSVWMSYFSDHRLAPSGKASVKALFDAYADRGIDLIPWCVPKGLDPVAEADLAIEVIDVTGSLILDVEPYDYFWTGSWDNLFPYMNRIRDAHPNAWIGLSFDPRYGTYGPWYVDKYKAIHFEDWLPFVDGLLPQDYWDTFQVDAEWEIEHTWDRIGDLGKKVIFALPGGDSDPERFRRGAEAAYARADVSIWRRGSFRVANEMAIRAIDHDVPDTCEEALVECDSLRAELEAVLATERAENARLQDVVSRYRTYIQSAAQFLAGVIEEDD